VSILNVTSRQAAYCEELLKKLRVAGVRAKWDDRNEKLGFKIREAQLQKIPYMLIIGDNEVDKRTLSVRLKNGQMLNNLSVDEFVSSLKNEISERLLTSPLATSQPDAAQAGDPKTNLNQEAGN
jgi:threonyl-tRNA synthetase